MTEEEWMGDADFRAMTAWVCPAYRKASLVTPRKFRLFVVACARLLPEDAIDQHCKRAIDIAESFADGELNLSEMRSAGSTLSRQAIVIRAGRRRQPPETAVDFAYLACGTALQMAWSSLQSTPERVVEAFGTGNTKLISETRSSIRSVLRDIVGNPFRPVAFDPAWRTSTAVALATQMYDTRDFSIMPILADALQDAGCDNDDILSHCRDPQGTHVRGCWVVDLVLGKS